MRSIEDAVDNQRRVLLADNEVRPVLEPREHVGASQETGYEGPVIHKQADILVFCGVQVSERVDHV